MILAYSELRIEKRRSRRPPRKFRCNVGAGWQADPPTGGEAMTPPRWRGFLLIGLLCLSAALSLKGYQKWQENLLSFSETPQTTVQVEEGDLPEKIIIPKAKVDLPVSGAKVIENHWEIFPDRASYLLGSGLPGRKGNAVIYAHNKSHLFGPIRWLVVGNEIKVVNQKGEEFIYEIVETKTVSPEAIEVLSPTEDSTLTLYTCTGFLERERFVVRAELIHSFTSFSQ